MTAWLVASGSRAVAGDETGRPILRLARATATLRHDGHAVAVGGAGDLVVVGDWDCDGIDTPAVLRPSSHSVWVFDRWDSRPRRATTSADVDAIGARDGTACDDLVAIDSAGRATSIARR
jgi:hypothetical protein